MEERRAGGLKRVPVEALVEICGRDAGGAPPFEAESIDVSGRGMHVRTAYLPDVGTPLVCRLEHEGREIVVEGEVAWQSPAERGGEFGIQFTALDSGSVDALRALCELTLTREEPEPEPESSSADSAPDPGSRVRLHIEGLGAPMKASVQGGNVRRVQVASNLEFLKVGRTLELEEMGSGERRPARIFGVDVVIDPKSQVPQLVVALRFQDVEDHTPEPSVVDSAPSTMARSPRQPAIRPGAASPVASTDEDAWHADGGDDDFDDGAPFDAEPGEAPAQLSEDGEIVEEVGRFKTRAGEFADVAGAGAKKAGAVIADVGGAAAVGLGRFFKGAAAKVQQYQQNKAGGDSRPRRTTAAPPSGVLSADGRRLRPQSMPPRSESVEEQPKPSRVAPQARKAKARKIAAAGGLVVLIATVGVLAFKKPAPPPGAEVDAPAVTKTVAQESPVGDVTEVDDQGNPLAAPAAPSVLKAGPSEADEAGGITADVPLFGPTPMATLEPAPLGEPPDLGAVSDDASEEEKEMAAAKEVADETFEEKPKTADKKPAKKANPNDVAPWGKGQVSTPTIHRLRLDQPGGAIKGAINPTGFTVVVPGVKVMESAAGIQKRDSRIARVRTRNGSSGAEVTFQFKESVPGYRVRLRKDFVEFLISAPTKKR